MSEFKKYFLKDFSNTFPWKFAVLYEGGTEQHVKKNVLSILAISTSTHGVCEKMKMEKGRLGPLLLLELRKIQGFFKGCSTVLLHEKAEEADSACGPFCLLC